MNALDLVKRSASLERPPRLPGRREIRELIARDIAQWERHQAESGFTGDARVWTHEDGQEVWEHRQPDGEWVRWP